MEKIFIGKVDTKTTQFGEIIRISLSSKDKEKLKQYSSESGYTNISILTNREGKKYAEINTYNVKKSEPNNEPDEIKWQDVEPFK